MSRRIRSITGRIEYDGFSYSVSGEYCHLRLCLHDLPPAAIVKIYTTWERERKRDHYRQLYAYRMPGWKSDYLQEFEIESAGRVCVEIRTKKYTHRTEYRIDGDLRRPVREQRDKLELRLEDHFYDLFPKREQPLDLPIGSLWQRPA